VSPPDLHPIILAVAHLLEITEVYEVGGAQAIAALALGTESIQPVDKIFGPGNQYVTAAKQLAAHGSGVAIDLPAGPSELLVIADDGATPSAVVADLLSQAEHGPDSQVILLTTSKELFELLPEELERQLQTLPRGEVAAQALAESAAVLVPSTEVAIEISNRYAPEHLIVATRDADDLKSAITAAGSVFLGYFTPESLGDYASGTNHTLPTGGAARGYSGVSLESFQKEITFQRASFEGLQRLAATVECMASAEGLEAHRRAVTVRKEAHE
ncbi:histidinol dehydrogenase, partial [bacterium]|nr:histidinol dehydrogenase [bacterium]